MESKAVPMNKTQVEKLLEKVANIEEEVINEIQLLQIQKNNPLELTESDIKHARDLEKTKNQLLKVQQDIEGSLSTLGDGPEELLEEKIKRLKLVYKTIENNTDLAQNEPYEVQLLKEEISDLLTKILTREKAKQKHLETVLKDYKLQNSKGVDNIIQTKQMISVLQNEKIAIENGQRNTSKDGKLSREQILRKDIEKIGTLHRFRQRQLTKFISKHYPPLTKYPHMKTMGEILELLCEKAVRTPHDPWIELDETFFEQYLNMSPKYEINHQRVSSAFKPVCSNFELVTTLAPKMLYSSLKVGNFVEKGITVALFKDVSNLEELKRLVINGKLEASFVNASLIVNTFHVLSAVNQAFNNQMNQTMKTRSIYSEILYCLSPSKNINESLRTFGISDKSTSILVVITSELSNTLKNEISHSVKGESVNLEELTNLHNENQIKKIFKIGEVELKQSSLINSVVTRLATKDITN